MVGQICNFGTYRYRKLIFLLYYNRVVLFVLTARISYYNTTWHIVNVQEVDQVINKVLLAIASAAVLTHISISAQTPEERSRAWTMGSSVTHLSPHFHPVNYKLPPSKGPGKDIWAQASSRQPTFSLAYFLWKLSEFMDRVRQSKWPDMLFYQNLVWLNLCLHAVPAL